MDYSRHLKYHPSDSLISFRYQHEISLSNIRVLIISCILKSLGKLIKRTLCPGSHQIK